MNIFYLDKDPRLCAQYHCNSHVVKQILESAQLLSTAHRVTTGHYLVPEMDAKIYQSTHTRHPSFYWVIRSRGNYEFLFSLFEELLIEFEFRYRHKHSTGELLEYLRKAPIGLPERGFTEFTQVVPSDCLREDPLDPVGAYRAYYVQEKLRLLEYGARGYPSWLLDAFEALGYTK